MHTEHFDVLIVGAGISGIGAAYHMQTTCPSLTYAVLEARKNLGGTWDLFRYPGIRSDSDMHTLGYAFRPWRNPKDIADGDDILTYLHETAAEYGIDSHIRFERRVVEASWSSRDAKWTVVTKAGDEGELETYTCHFLFACTGYYDYEAGYLPDFPDMHRFRGRIVHPQAWTPDVEYAAKRVVVIGSGATAVTLVPELARTAAHVTMLQRSPTYVVSRPAEDPFGRWLRERLPPRLAATAMRWKNVLIGMLFFQLSKRRPEAVKRRILDEVKRELGPDYDVDKHFNPRYNPWDQRVCLVPNGDLFGAVREGRASVVTDQIERFTEKGILLQSGTEIEADLIVTATGLVLKLLGGISVEVDGTPIDFSKTVGYKGMMFSGVPNFASCFGYTNASWTLKCDLTCAYACRLLNYMTKAGYRQCTPRVSDPTLEYTPWLDFSSGYVRRSIGMFPRQGSKAPWRVYQNYALDLLSLKFGPLEKKAMHFE